MQAIDANEQNVRKVLLKIAKDMYREKQWEFPVTIMRKMARKYPQLSWDESVSFYKSHNSLLRIKSYMCKILSALCKDKDNWNDCQLIYERRIKEFNEFYDETDTLIDQLIIANLTRVKIKVYFLIIKVKFHLYKVKMIDDVEERKVMAEPCLIAYRYAYELTISNSEFSPISSITFVVAYEYSMFLANTMQLKIDAYDIARQTYDRANSLLHKITDRLELKLFDMINSLRNRLYDEWVEEVCS
jgi:hypothetical protein